MNNKAPSYEELKDNESFWLQVTPYIAGMNETFDGTNQEEPISSFLYYESNVTAIDYGQKFPFPDLRVNIREESAAEIQKLSAKYPIGFFSFFEDSALVTLMCRNELASRMIATLSMVKSSEIEISITLPVLPKELPNVFPILNYGYSVRSTSEEK